MSLVTKFKQAHARDPYIALRFLGFFLFIVLCIHSVKGCIEEEEKQRRSSITPALRERERLTLDRAFPGCEQFLAEAESHYYFIICHKEDGAIDAFEVSLRGGDYLYNLVRLPPPALGIYDNH